MRGVNMSIAYKLGRAVARYEHFKNERLRVAEEKLERQEKVLAEKEAAAKRVQDINTRKAKLKERKQNLRAHGGAKKSPKDFFKF